MESHSSGDTTRREDKQIKIKSTRGLKRKLEFKSNPRFDPKRFDTAYKPRRLIDEERREVPRSPGSLPLSPPRSHASSESQSPPPFTPIQATATRKSPSILKGKCNVINNSEAVCDNTIASIPANNCVMQALESIQLELQSVKAHCVCHCKGRMVDRFSREERNEIIAMQDWLFTEEPLNNGLKVIVPNMEMGVPRSWLNGIYDKQMWLMDEHMNSLMILLAMERHSMSGESIWNWTLLETHCWVAMVQRDYDSVVSIVQPYVKGDAPKYVGQAWVGVDTIYGMANLNANHWVLYVISLTKKQITVYDSNYSTQTWLELLVLFNTFTFNLVKLLGGDAWRVGLPLPEFEVVVYRGAPQQVNSFDCGLMALEYFRALINDHPVDEINPFTSTDQRIRYCSELFKFGEGLGHQH